MDESDNESVAADSASEFEYEEENDIEINNSDGDEDSDVQMEIEPPQVRKASYTLMNRADLEARQMRCITEASELLDLPQEESIVLLRNHGWDLARLQEAWFSDEAKVRERCGIAPSSSASSSSASGGPSGRCPVCMDQCQGMVALSCGHYVCEDCWRGYLHSQVDEGKAAVAARCPQHKCPLVVPSQLFMRFCDDARQTKYKEWYLRTYVDDNPTVKWCTNPAGCSGPYACEYQGTDQLDIRCNCGFLWCWACGEEAHRPADCKTVGQWNIKNSAESENISWIMANTKQCPRCHKPIEKNQGCNHMSCSKAGGCGHEFCWLCLGDWSTHGTSTGGYYQCNIYDKQSKEGKHDAEESTRQKAKHALDKYMFFFERFMDHDRGMKLTVREEQDVEGKVKTLHDNHGFDIIELQFLYDALRQVRTCRRVLKWTYVFGYYMDDAGPERNLFEHLQKDLEEKTDNLHEMLEKDFNQFFDTDDAVGTASKDKFMTFRSHVTNFTNVTTKFMQRIMEDLRVGGGLTGSVSPKESSQAASSVPPVPTAAFGTNWKLRRRKRP